MFEKKLVNANVCTYVEERVDVMRHFKLCKTENGNVCKICRGKSECYETMCMRQTTVLSVVLWKSDGKIYNDVKEKYEFIGCFCTSRNPYDHDKTFKNLKNNNSKSWYCLMVRHKS